MFRDKENMLSINFFFFRSQYNTCSNCFGENMLYYMIDAIEKFEIYIVVTKRRYILFNRFLLNIIVIQQAFFCASIVSVNIHLKIKAKLGVAVIGLTPFLFGVEYVWKYLVDIFNKFN